MQLPHLCPKPIFFWQDLPPYSVRATRAKLMYPGRTRTGGHQPALLPKAHCQTQNWRKSCGLRCSPEEVSVLRQRAARRAGPACKVYLSTSAFQTGTRGIISGGKTEPSPKLTSISCIICPPSIRDEGNRQLLPSSRKRTQWLLVVRARVLVS